MHFLIHRYSETELKGRGVKCKERCEDHKGGKYLETRGGEGSGALILHSSTEPACSQKLTQHAKASEGHRESQVYQGAFHDREN